MCEARVRYTVPENPDQAEAEYWGDPWVNGIVEVAEDLSGVGVREILQGRHRRHYSVPLETLGGTGADLEKLAQVTPDTVEVIDDA